MKRVRTFICTSGTSIGRSCPALRGIQTSRLGWDVAVPELESQIREHLGRLDLGAASGRIEASAETHSLHKLGCTADDRVILIATETAEGRACANAVRQALVDHFGLEPDRVKVEKAEGLQVHDARRLREVGLSSLIDVILRTIQAHQFEGEMLLNPTGGFKGVVPFVAIVGMLYRIPNVYLFEHADEPIRLPPLPITFDAEMFDRAMPALDRISQEGTIPLEKYFSLIEGFRDIERDAFGALIETDGLSATLSPLVYALYESGQIRRGEIRMSPDVRKQLGGASGPQREQMERLLAKASIPLWRVSHRHAFPSTDLESYKPGGVAARFAGFSEKSTFFVCAYFASHDLYERELPKLRRRDFDPEEFAEWSPPEAAPLPQEVERRQPDAPGTEREAGEGRMESRPSPVADEREIRRLRRENVRLKEEVASLRVRRTKESGPPLPPGFRRVKTNRNVKRKRRGPRPDGTVPGAPGMPSSPRP